MESVAAPEAGERPDEELAAGVRLVELDLPEDEGEGLGFRLTRTLWDPYPWVRDVVPESRADSAGLRPGDCLLQADGRDLLGMPVGQVAALIRGDGRARGAALLCWSCGVHPYDDPELLWSCGGGARGERARRALGGVVRALACSVCGATAPAARRPALACARDHLYCQPCWSRLERCALCRESLPPKESSYARSLLADKVFEAIASEYEVKEGARQARKSPARSLADKFPSDPNLRQSCARAAAYGVPASIPSISVRRAQAAPSGPGCPSAAPHRLLTRARLACSLADLHAARLSCSMNNIHLNEPRGSDKNHSNSMDNLKNDIGSSCEPPVFVLTAPPIYVLTCDHDKA